MGHKAHVPGMPATAGTGPFIFSPSLTCMSAYLKIARNLVGMG